MYLYLVDGIKDEIVRPIDGDPVYPIEIPTESQVSFVKATLPILMTGLNCFRAVSKIAGWLKAHGFVDTNDTKNEKDEGDNDDNGDENDQEKKLSGDSICTMANINPCNQGDSIQVRRFRGSALREAKLFFNKQDPGSTFCGLVKQYASDGRVVWTIPPP